MEGTLFNAQKHFLSLMAYCPCGIKNEDGEAAKITYICMPNQGCKYYESLSEEEKNSPKRYYCENCMEQRHNHLPIKIFSETRKIDKLWQDIKKDFYAIENAFITKTTPYNALI